MELLAPAGNKESLFAAVNNGANAVYLGGVLFNARRYAGNFDDQTLSESVDHCHIHGVKTYITLNTLILDREMRDALSYAAKLYALGIDAVLVQDIGLLELIRRELPELTVHASTQMAIHDIDGVRAAERLGIKRVVLARELSLENIRYISENSDMELEVFVHGALCMSTSGNCLFSSMIGERSGNRGTCAQPCRKRISITGLPREDDYHLSLSDLCMLDHIEELKRSGVCSLKIEGRMKSPAYVGAAVRAYRAALDGKDFSGYGKQLQTIFNRGGIRTGYFFGDDAHTDCVAESSDTATELITNTERKRPVKLNFSLFEGSPARLIMQCADNEISVQGEIAAKAQKAPDLDRYREQLSKLGNTPFAAEECEIDTDGNSYLAIREINELRRTACDKMTEALCPKKSIVDVCLPTDVARDPQKTDTRILAIVHNAEKIKTAFEAGADRVIFEPWKYAELDVSELIQYHDRLMLSLPASILAREEHENIIKLLSSGCFCGGEANHFSQIELFKDLPERYAGFLCNAYNQYTVASLMKMGFTDVLLSPELTKAQIRDILLRYSASLFVYGRVPLMQLRHCPIKEHKGCQSCHGEAGVLTDESGRRFPLKNVAQSGGCLLGMLNCDTLDIIDVASSVPPCGSWVLSFYEENDGEIVERIKAARAASKGETVAQKGATRGHWNRPLL